MAMEATEPVTATLFGLDGFRVLAAADAAGELELLVETTAELVPCPACGAVARAKDRRPTWVRDLPLGGRPVVICWVKRIWSCPHPLCEQRTWTEQHVAIALRDHAIDEQPREQGQHERERLEEKRHREDAAPFLPLHRGQHAPDQPHHEEHGHRGNDDRDPREPRSARPE